MSKVILEESLRDINSSQTYSKGMQFFKMHNPLSKFCENMIKIQEFMHLKEKSQQPMQTLKIIYSPVKSKLHTCGVLCML